MTAGAMVTALGGSATGVFTNSQNVWNQMHEVCIDYMGLSNDVLRTLTRNVKYHRQESNQETVYGGCLSSTTTPNRCVFLNNIIFFILTSSLRSENTKWYINRIYL